MHTYTAKQAFPLRQPFSYPGCKFSCTGTIRRRHLAPLSTGIEATFQDSRSEIATLTSKDGDTPPPLTGSALYTFVIHA